MDKPRVLRRDPVSGQEVIFAPARRSRPHQQVVGAEPNVASAVCPFCPGNEAYLSEILWQLGDETAWHSRAVINRYPIVTPPAGHHEVIIDTPRHALSISQMASDTWFSLIEAYAERYRALASDWPYVSLFRNVGKRAGASLEHPHSQLIALGHKPEDIRFRQRRLRHLHKQDGICFLCKSVAGTEMADIRLVARSGGYVALIPEAPAVPFEVWIVPVAHSSQFGHIDAAGRQGLADILTDVLYRMGRSLGDFDHNLLLMDSENDSRHYLHWFLRIRPIAEAGGGFEQTTGIAVNTSCPESDAEKLRQVT